MIDYREQLKSIRSFPSLVRFLRDELDWPIATEDFEELTFEYSPEELGIDAANAAKIVEIKRLRPLVATQPWGIFFVKFEPKRLPVVALRRILNRVAVKKRASANSAERAAWAADDLLFVSNYGEGDQRQISFAHFSEAPDGRDLPTLKVLGWDNLDTALHLDAAARELTEHLAWPKDDTDADAWRKQWRAAFTLGHREVISTSKDLSIRLAVLASAIRDRIRTALAIETEKGPLTRLMTAFQEALVHDLDADGFADMYAQTIAYGLLSARIADPDKKTADDLPAQMRTNPFLRELMETFLHVGGRRGKAGGPGIDFDELGVGEVIEMLNHANMGAVIRDFGDRNPLEDPVMHFYELFLAEYDPEKRLKRGVFYTPRPIVAAMVRRVHVILCEERGMTDGLADPSVSILDPASGTGTFLVEAIGLIHDVLTTRWRAQGASADAIRANWNEYVPLSLLPRLFGFELMMAPYAIAHLKIALKLQETGYDFGSAERVNVVLTDSLDRESGEMEQLALLMPALAHEAQVARNAKKIRFSVVMGNPPYKNNSESTLAQVAERFPRLLDTSRLAAQVQTRNIRDDYAWFYAAADAYADDRHGIVCLITSDSYTRIESYQYFREQVLIHYRVLGLLRIGRSVFAAVSPRISFATLELLRRDVPRKDASGCSVGVTDIRGLAEGVSPSNLATTADPRLGLLSQVADGRATLPAPVTHEPTEGRRWSFLLPSPKLADRVLVDSLPVFKRGQERIFAGKWPGIITAFDELLKSREADDLAERMSSFFEACYSPGTRRQRALEEWASSHGIRERSLDRLEHVASEIVKNRVKYSQSNVKRSVSGSIPNELRWYPPPAYRHYIYYEPRIKIPRNVNPGRFEGWGSMEQWRDDNAHRMSPKLIFTTSTNPRSGYKAFVVDDEWFVKLHGGTSQQYNFTGLLVGGRPQRLAGAPNNLAGGGERMLDTLHSFELDDASLLHLVAAVYNSSLAERFLSEESGEELRIRIPSKDSQSLCVELVSQSRRMRNLHQLLYDGSSEDREGLVDCVHGLVKSSGRVVISSTGVQADVVKADLDSLIASEQELLDQLVESYYGLESEA